MLRFKNTLLEFAASPKPWEAASVHPTNLKHLLQLSTTLDLLTGLVMALASHKFNSENM